MSYLTLLNAMAQVVGGTQPDAGHASVPTAQQPYWYSGYDTGDSTGVSGLAGCHSLPTEVLGNLPVAMILPDRREPLAEDYPVQGEYSREDTIRVRVFAGNNDMQTVMGQLVNVADAVPAAFNAHLELLATQDVMAAICDRCQFLEVEWGGTVYFAIEFTVRVQRSSSVVYQG